MTSHKELRAYEIHFVYVHFLVTTTPTVYIANSSTNPQSRQLRYKSELFC